MSTARPYCFAFGDIRREVFFAATERSHKAHPVMLRDCSDPAFLMDIPPTQKTATPRRSWHLSPLGKERIACVSRPPRFGRCAATHRLRKHGSRWFENRRIRRAHRNVRGRCFRKNKSLNVPASAAHRIEEDRSCRAGNTSIISVRFPILENHSDGRRTGRQSTPAITKTAIPIARTAGLRTVFFHVHLEARGQVLAGEPFGSLRRNGNGTNQRGHRAIEALLICKFVGAREHGTPLSAWNGRCIRPH